MKHAEKKKKYFESLKEKAHSRGGQVVSNTYESARTPIKFKCSVLEHPVFENQPTKVLKENQWCPYCSGRKGNFSEQVKELIEGKGGTMIGAYRNNNTSIKVLCEKGHTFHPMPCNLKAGKWCPECAGITGDFETPLREYIESRGGRLVSKYINADTKVEVECPHHGIFESTPYHLKNRRQWCVRCQISEGQEECHQLFEELTGHGFKCERPFLIEEGQRRLRLDGYCSEMHLAFEYHGPQHYKPIDYFGGMEGLEDQQLRDSLKLKRCQELGICLVVIPYTVVDKREFIQKSLLEYQSNLVAR